MGLAPDPLVNRSPVTVAQLALSTAATQLADKPAMRGVMVQNDLANAVNIRVGDSSITTSRGIQLAPGDSRFFPVSNANLLYAIAESGTPNLNYEVT